MEAVEGNAQPPAAGGAAAAAGGGGAAAANQLPANQRAFWQAITVGEFETVQVLLDHRLNDIDINLVDETGEQRNGCTALHLAILEMPTWKGTEGRNGIQTAEFVKKFFQLLLDNGADMDICCKYGGEWYLQTSAGKTKSFYPEGYNALGLVLQFVEITRGADVISGNVTKRLELIRDIFLKHIKTQHALKLEQEDRVEFPSLATKLGVMLQNGQFSDMVIECGSVSTQVHRMILAAHSKVFAAMLENQFAESSTGKIIITEVDPEPVRILIRYMYTDTLDNVSSCSPEVVHQLLRLANQYDIQSLLHLCSNVLVKHHMNVENAARILQVADQNEAKLLRQKALDFISRNIEAVMVVEDFKSLGTELIQEVLKSVVTTQVNPNRNRKRQREESTTAPYGQYDGVRAPQTVASGLGVAPANEP